MYGHFSQIFIIYTTFALIVSGDFFFNRIYFCFINKKYIFLFLFEKEATGDIYELGGNFNLVVSIKFFFFNFYIKKLRIGF